MKCVSTIAHCVTVAGVLGLIAAASGCSRGEPLERKVSAASPVAFARWQNRLADDFPPEKRRQIEEALQEIRLKIMGDREATGSAAIDEAFRARIHDRPLREAIQLGWESRLLRLRAEGQALEKVLEKNSTLQTREGDTVSERYLVELHQKQVTRLERIRADIVATEKELEPLLRRTGRRMLVDDHAPVLISAPPVKPRT